MTTQQDIAALKAKKDQFSKVEDALFAQVGAATRADAFANFPLLCAAIDAELATGVSPDNAAKAVAAVEAEWLALAPEATAVVSAIVAYYNLALTFLGLVPGDTPATPPATPVDNPTPPAAP